MTIKLVVLKLDSDLPSKGFNVFLEVGPEKHRPAINEKGRLPSDPELCQQLEDYLKKYRQIGESVGLREIKPIGVWHSVPSFYKKVERCRKSSQQLAIDFKKWLRSFSEVQDPKRDRVRILAIFGSSPELQTEEDEQFLKDLKNVDIHFLIEPRRQEIGEMLYSQNWHILFFAGHGETQDETGKIHLRSDETLEIEDLLFAFKNAVDRGLRLAIFNYCDGLGLVRELDRLQMPTTIVMKQPVFDEVARAFLKHFLDNFSSGMPLHLVVRSARERLHHQENLYPCASWLPVICQHADEPLPTFRNEKPNNIWKTNIAKIRNFTYPVRKVGSALLAAAGLYYCVFHQFPNILNRLGVGLTDYHEVAIRYFELALQINRDNRQALNNLGYIYEEMGKFDKAKEYYGYAMNFGSISGCNNSARLDIIMGNNDDALNLLNRCLVMTDNPFEDPFLRTLGTYTILKNMGWAYLKQEEYREAEKSLEAAIQIEEELDRKQGAANCLLAKVFEIQDKNEDALIQWQKCLDYSVNSTPEEIQWQQEAWRILNQQGER